MKKVVFLSFVLVSWICAAVISFGAPVWGETTELKQPDNSMVKVRVYGDEYYQQITSLDGYTLMRDPKTHWICYAKRNSDGNDLVSTGVVYKPNKAKDGSSDNYKIKTTLKKGITLDAKFIKEKVKKTKKTLDVYGRSASNGFAIGQAAPTITATANNSPLVRASASATVEGNVKGLTLLIDFPDCKANIPKADIDNMINQPGYTGYGNNGSVRDYFFDVSGGKVTYTNYVTEYYTAKHNKTYYNDPAVPFGDRARELLLEALNDLEARGFDFTTLTLDSENRIKALNCFYAGSPDVGWGSGLWPHSSWLGDLFTADGVKSGSYQITGLSNDGISIGTFIHENGHMLFGWIDLVDNYEQPSAGVGYYCIMGYINSVKNPVPPNPYFRELQGWVNHTFLNNYPQGSQLTATSGSLSAYRYYGPTQNEFFMIENVFKDGRYS